MQQKGAKCKGLSHSPVHTAVSISHHSQAVSQQRSNLQQTSRTGGRSSETLQSGLNAKLHRPRLLPGQRLRWLAGLPA